VLKLNVELRQVVEPLIHETLTEPLNSFNAKHPLEAERAGLDREACRRRIAGLAAGYFVEREGNARWRGIIDQRRPKQLVVELARSRLRYWAYAKMTSIHTEDITKLTQQCRSKNNP
jgi:hypothetical protein